MDLIQRAELAQAAVDRFADRPLRMGRIDCARVAGFVLAGAGHHNPAEGLGYGPKTALATLKRLGWDSLDQAIDRCGLERIPLAMALPADLLWTVSNDSMGSLGMAIGNGRALGFADAGSGVVCMVGGIEAYLIAWRLTWRI